MNTDFDTNELQQIANALNTFPEVTWDRYTQDDYELIAYGWIERDDAYKDFMLIVVDLVDFTFWYTTSSAKYSQAFHNRINDNPKQHSKCRRVESMFPTVKAVRLKPTADPPATA